jgi:hypothetical protein
MGVYVLMQQSEVSTDIFVNKQHERKVTSVYEVDIEIEANGDTGTPKL